MKVWERYLTKEQYDSLSRFEKERINERENAVDVGTTTYLLMNIALVILATYTFVWFNKVSLFLSIILFVFSMFYTFAVKAYSKDYKKQLKELKGRE